MATTPSPYEGYKPEDSGGYSGYSGYAGYGQGKTIAVPKREEEEQFSYEGGRLALIEESERQRARISAAGFDPDTVDFREKEPVWASGLKKLGDLGVLLDWLFLDAPTRSLLGGITGLVQGEGFSKFWMTGDEVDPYATELGQHAPTGKELLLMWGMDQGNDRKGKFDAIDGYGLLSEVLLSPAAWFSGGLSAAAKASVKGGTKALRGQSGKILGEVATHIDDFLKASPDVMKAIATEVGDESYVHKLIARALGRGADDIPSKLKTVDQLSALLELDKHGLLDNVLIAGRTARDEIDVARAGLLPDLNDLIKMIDSPAIEESGKKLIRTLGHLGEEAYWGNRQFRELALRTAEEMGDFGGIRLGLPFHQLDPKLRGSKTIVSSRKLYEILDRHGIGYEAVEAWRRSIPGRAMFRTFVSDNRLRKLESVDQGLANQLINLKRIAENRTAKDLHRSIDGLIEVLNTLPKRADRFDVLRYIEAPGEIASYFRQVLDDQGVTAFRDAWQYLRDNQGYSSFTELLGRGRDADMLDIVRKAGFTPEVVRAFENAIGGAYESDGARFAVSILEEMAELEPILAKYRRKAVAVSEGVQAMPSKYNPDGTPNASRAAIDNLADQIDDFDERVHELIMALPGGDPDREAYFQILKRVSAMDGEYALFRVPHAVDFSQITQAQMGRAVEVLALQAETMTPGEKGRLVSSLFAELVQMQMENDDAAKRFGFVVETLWRDATQATPETPLPASVEDTLLTLFENKQEYAQLALSYQEAGDAFAAGKRAVDLKAIELMEVLRAPTDGADDVADAVVRRSLHTLADTVKSQVMHDKIPDSRGLVRLVDDVVDASHKVDNQSFAYMLEANSAVDDISRVVDPETVDLLLTSMDNNPQALINSFEAAVWTGKDSAIRTSVYFEVDDLETFAQAPLFTATLDETLKIPTVRVETRPFASPDGRPVIRGAVRVHKPAVLDMEDYSKLINMRKPNRKVGVLQPDGKFKKISLVELVDEGYDSIILREDGKTTIHLLPEGKDFHKLMSPQYDTWQKGLPRGYEETVIGPMADQARAAASRPFIVRYVDDAGRPMVQAFTGQEASALRGGNQLAAKGSPGYGQFLRRVKTELGLDPTTSIDVSDLDGYVPQLRVLEFDPNKPVRFEEGMRAWNEIAEGGDYVADLRQVLTPEDVAVNVDPAQMRLYHVTSNMDNILEQGFLTRDMLNEQVRRGMMEEMVDKKLASGDALLMWELRSDTDVERRVNSLINDDPADFSPADLRLRSELRKLDRFEREYMEAAGHKAASGFDGINGERGLISFSHSKMHAQRRLDTFRAMSDAVDTEDPEEVILRMVEVYERVLDYGDTYMADNLVNRMFEGIGEVLRNDIPDSTFWSIWQDMQDGRVLTPARFDELARWNTEIKVGYDEFLSIISRHRQTFDDLQNLADEVYGKFDYTGDALAEFNKMWRDMRHAYFDFYLDLSAGDEAQALFRTRLNAARYFQKAHGWMEEMATKRVSQTLLEGMADETTGDLLPGMVPSNAFLAGAGQDLTAIADPNTLAQMDQGDLQFAVRAMLKSQVFIGLFGDPETWVRMREGHQAFGMVEAVIDRMGATPDIIELSRVAEPGWGIGYGPSRIPRREGGVAASLIYTEVDSEVKAAASRVRPVPHTVHLEAADPEFFASELKVSTWYESPPDGDTLRNWSVLYDQANGVGVASHRITRVDSFGVPSGTVEGLGEIGIDEATLDGATAFNIRGGPGGGVIRAHMKDGLYQPMVIDTLVIPEGVRGQGHGTEMLDAFKDWVGSTYGGRDVELTIPSYLDGEDANRLVRFYKRAGFEDDYVWRNFQTRQDWDLLPRGERPPHKMVLDLQTRYGEVRQGQVTSFSDRVWDTSGQNRVARSAVGHEFSGIYHTESRNVYFNVGDHMEHLDQLAEMGVIDPADFGGSSAWSTGRAWSAFGSGDARDEGMLDATARGYLSFRRYSNGDVAIRYADDSQIPAAKKLVTDLYESDLLKAENKVWLDNSEGIQYMPQGAETPTGMVIDFVEGKGSNLFPRAKNPRQRVYELSHFVNNGPIRGAGIHAVIQQTARGVRENIPVQLVLPATNDLAPVLKRFKALGYDVIEDTTEFVRLELDLKRWNEFLQSNPLALKTGRIEDLGGLPIKYERVFIDMDEDAVLRTLKEYTLEGYADKLRKDADLFEQARAGEWSAMPKEWAVSAGLPDYEDLSQKVRNAIEHYWKTGDRYAYMNTLTSDELAIVEDYVSFARAYQSELGYKTPYGDLLKPGARGDDLMAMERRGVDLAEDILEDVDVMDDAFFDDFLLNDNVRTMKVQAYRFVDEKYADMPVAQKKVAANLLTVVADMEGELNARGLTDNIAEGFKAKATAMKLTLGDVEIPVAPGVAEEAVKRLNNMFEEPGKWVTWAKQYGLDPDSYADFVDQLWRGSVEFWQALDGGMFEGLTEGKRVTAMQKFLGERLGVAERYWIDLNPIDVLLPAYEYMPHQKLDEKSLSFIKRVFGKVPDHMLERVPTGVFQRPVSTKMPNIDYHRQFMGSIDHINKVVGYDLFTEDPAKAIAIYIQRSISAIGSYDLIDSFMHLRDSFGRAVVQPAKYVDGDWVAPKGYKVFSLGEIKGIGRDIEKVLKMYPEFGSEMQDLLRGLHSEHGMIKFMARVEIVDELEIAAKAFTNDLQMNEYLKAYDQIQGVWKAYATVLRPGFHARNWLTNIWQNLHAGVVNPKWYKQAMDVQQVGMQIEDFMLKELANNGKLWSPGAAWKRMIDLGMVEPQALALGPGGMNYSIDTLYEMARDYGMIGTGRIGSDIHVFTDQQLQRLHPMNRTFNMFSQAWYPTSAGRRAGEMVENNARMAHFIAMIDATGDPAAASWSVRKYLFDYNELTDIERNVFKRAIPFYAWMRKNAELQVNHLIHRPFLTATAVRVSTTLSEIDDTQYRPQWVDEIGGFALPGMTLGGINKLVNKITGGVFDLDEESEHPTYVALGLPYLDLLRYNARDIISSMSPIVRAPVEVITNYNVYMDRKIEDYPGQLRKAPATFLSIDRMIQKTGNEGIQAAWLQAMNNWGVHRNELTGNIETGAWFTYTWQNVFPFLEAYGKAMPTDDAQAFTHMLNFLAGVKLIPLDQVQQGYYQEKDEVQALTYGIRAKEERGYEFPTWSALTAQEQNEAVMQMQERGVER